MTLTDRAKALRLRIDQVGATQPEQARQLVSFAWACVRKTTLTHLRGRRPLRNALIFVQRWLKGEAVEQLLRAMHDDVFEAALGVGRFEPDMTGLRAACWSVFELYQAALAVTTGEPRTVARKAAWAVSLAACASDKGLSPAVLTYQESLFAEMFTLLHAPAPADAV